MSCRVPHIDTIPKKDNSSDYLKKAHHFYEQSNFPKAYKYFVQYFESLNSISDVSPEDQGIFTGVVTKIATVLEETDDVEELLKCYLQTINLFPDNYFILNSLGAYMFKLGENDIAKKYLELALESHPYFLPVKRNLLHLSWNEMPRWHFRMMNDRLRNQAYDKAITSLISKGYKNAIDIGAGCGLLSLIASKNPEASVVAIEESKTLARMCKDVLIENNVKNVVIMNCYSTDIKEPLGKCNLIVTETFDVALFGERVLESIHHALSTLKTEDDFKVVPARAKVYITGISCPQLYSKYQYLPKPSLQRLHLDNLCVSQLEWKPYEGEYLAGRNYRFVTDTQVLFEVNFSDQEQINKLLSSKYEHEVQLKCNEGVVHAFVIWFDLYLDEDTWITTNPNHENCAKCWEQAIIYIDHSKYLKEGDMLNLEVSMEDCRLSVRTLDEGPTHDCFKVSKDIVTILNDQKLVDTYISVADLFKDRQLDVMDLTPFPLVGFLLAKNGCRVFHSMRNKLDQDFFDYILRVNSISPERFVMLPEGARCIDPEFVKPNSLILHDVIDTDGYLESNFFRTDSLEPAIVLPVTALAVAMMVYAPYIDCCNKVNDSNTLGFKTAKHMNQYSGDEHPNIEDLVYEQRTERVVFTLEDGVKVMSVTAVNTGLVNAVYYWYEMYYSDKIKFSTLDSSHYKKTCYFMKETKYVTKGENLSIECHVEDSVMKITEGTGQSYSE